MSNAKCLNLSHPTVKQNIKDISERLGLQNLTISLNEYKAVVRAFSIYKGIENEDVLDYIGSQEYDDFLNDYFNIGKSIEFSSDLEEKILEFLEQNKEYINTPLEDTTENRMVANGVYIATEEKAKIINLSNNKFIIKILKRSNEPIENKTLNELPSVIDLIKNVKPYVNNEDGSKSDKTLLVQKGSTYFLNYDNKDSKYGLSQVTALKALAREMEKLGLESDYIGVVPDTGVVYAKTKKYSILDRIGAYESSEDMFKNAEQHKQAISVLEFLSEKTGLNYKFITEEEALKILKLKNITNNVNAFCFGDTAYFIKGRTFNTDIASEEMLHPFVNSIKISNPEAFNSLLKEAKKSFPALSLQIESTYLSNKEEELVTQALSRAFRQDYEENPDHNSIADLIRKFFEAIKNWFSYNNDLPWFDKEGNVIDKLYAQDLSKTITLENLAKIINTEIELGNANFINRAAANKSSVTFTTSKGSYQQRTKENAERSDITIALAEDFTTYGERATKNFAGNKYTSHLIKFEGKPFTSQEIANHIAFDIINNKEIRKPIKLNIAGNGIYSLSEPQEYYNDLVTEVIKELQLRGIKIKEIRSGGQTGIDEAGIIAAQRLGIPAVVHGTKDWAFRGKDGKDVKGDEVAYKDRFAVSTQPTPKAKGKIIEINKKWTRNEVAKDSKNLYIFTDNTDRDSGKRLIDPKSKYAKKYGKNKHYPTMTQAVIRGLDNAMPVSTQRFYHEGAKGETGRWTDADFAEFRVTIDEEIEAIKKEWSSGKYKNLVIGSKDGFFNTEISNITKERTPKIYEYLENKLNELYNFIDGISNKTSSKNKPTLEDRVAEIENVYKTFKKVVFQGENFKKDHKYTIIEDGEEYDVDFSATTLNKALKSSKDLKDFSKIKNEEVTPPNGGVYPQRFVGNGFDAVVRKYFNGGINNFDSFDNISTGLKRSLLTQLKQLEKHFDSEFGEGKYKVITGFGDDEFVVGGYVSDAKYSYAVAGTLDMLVVTEDGDIYIYDMKTDSHKKGISKDNIQKYQGQLTLYKRFIAENFPELATRIKGIRIISADVRFGDLTAEDIHKGASIEFEAQDDGTLLHNGVPVEEKEGFVNIKINVTKGDNYSLVDLKQSALIEALEIDPLTFEEEKTLEETLASKTTDPITELEKIETTNDDSKKFKGSSEYKEFESNDEVDFTEENAFKTLVKPTERVYLGRQIMKTMSNFLNHLHTDDSFRLKLVDITGEPIYEKENYFIDKDRDKLLTKELMSEIFEYIKEEYFNYKDMEVDDPEFEKTRWIHNNFTAIVNGAFAELIELEGVSLVGGEVVQVGQEDNPVTNEDLSYREENAKQAYDISNRNTSVIASMNQTVKRELSLIHDYEYKEDGSISTIEVDGEDFPLYNTDKGFDIPKYLDKDVVITTIQKIVYSKKKVSGMIKALKAEQLNYPWLEQVISKLEANKDNYQSKFFNTFYKSRTNYIKVYKEEEGFGKDKQVTYIHADLRDSAKRDAILDKLNKKLFAEVVEELPPIFTKEKGNNAPGLVSIDKIQFEIFKEALKDLQGKKKKARETANEKAERIRKGLSDVFEILGIDEDVSLNYILDQKNKNRLNSLIDNFKALEKAFIARSLKREAVIAEDITNPYYGISETLAYFLKDHVEISYYDNGDNWMVFTQPTYIQTLIEKLRGAEVEEGLSYEESLGNLMKYDQFVSVGEDGSRVFVSKWLEELINNPESREIINHFVRTSIDNKKHFKQSPSEYLLGMLINFAAPTATNSKYDVPKDVAMYRMPIMSDKPAGDMLLFKKYGSVDLNNPKNNYNLDYMKEQIADMSFNFFKLEVNRMRAIREQLVEQINSDVEFYHIPRTKDKKSQWVTKDSKGKVVPIQFSHKKFIETRSLKRFNGFKFHYCPMFNAEMDNNTEVAQLVLDIINSSDENVIAEKFDALQERFTDIFIAGKEAEYQNFITNHANKLNKKALFNSIPQIGSEKQYDAFMQDFFWNDSFATMNIYNLTIIDPAFYKDTIDLQKRYAQMHASTSKVNTEAEFVFKEGAKPERVSDGKSRTLYISDLNVPSELAKVIPSLFKELANKEKNPTRKLELQILANNLAYEYNSIDVTDGQSYGTFTSFWKKLYMLGEDTPELNKAILDLKGNIEKIENGEFSLENYDLCLQAFKPFVYSQIEHPNDTQALGKYLCPTQIKNSEALIYLGMSILKGFKTKGFIDSSHILAGIMEVVEESHWTKDGNYRNDGIDTIAFHSAVKNGDYAEIDLNDCKDKAAVVSRLKQCLYGHPTKGSRYDQKFVKEYPFLEWGKQQEVPGHMQDHEQGEGSQNRVIVVSDLPEDFELKVGNKIYKSDKKSSAKAKLLKRYFDLIAEEMEDGVYSVREELQLNSEDKADKYKAISKYIINSIVKDAKYTDEMRKSFTALENGDFVGAVGDPSIADKLFSATFSLIKKNVNDQKFPGGPVVVHSVYGSENLGIAFDNPKTQEGMHYQIMITCPTEDLERRITVNTKKINSQMKKAGVKTLSRQYVDGELFDVVDALALGLITEDETLVECQRIPTEDKYSIFRCRVVKFLPRQIGERFVGPKEITRISGMDMDIDKVFTKFKYNLKSLEKKEKEGTLKPKERELLRVRRRRNEIFDIQYAVLGHPMSYANTLNTGNFEPLKELANKVDKSRGAEHSLMNISGQLYFFEQNGGGKEYVGIAALNNIAHHMCNIAELSFTEFPYFTINGRSSFTREKDELTTGNYRFDRTYSIFDDSRISRTIGMFVGASADNAKEAVLASINIVPTTATLAKGLLRMGIPLDTVVYMLNHPAVKNATRIALEANKASAFTSALSEALVEAQNNADYTNSIEELVANTNFLNEDLYSRTQDDSVLKKDKLFDIRILGFLNMMMPYCQAIADVSIVTSLNSTKNAVGPRVLDTIKRQLKIQRLFRDVRNGTSLISDSLLNIYDKIPYLKVLEECFSKLVPEICGDLSPVYASDFLNLISILESNGLDVVYMEEKDFNKLLNSWLLYKASGNKGVLDASFENRKKMIYDFPLRFIQAQRNGSLDNEFIKSLNTPTTMNKRNKILNITFNSIGKSRGTRSDLAASWEELATSDNSARRELSNDLMTYMMFRFGWSFSPKSAMNIAPNKAKEAYPNYKEIFSTTDEFNTADMMNFLYQYARNNWYGKMWVNPHLDKDEGMFKIVNGKSYYIVKDAERLTGLNFLKLGKNRYIRVNEVSFVKVERLGIENNFFEFDGSSNNGIFMKSVIDNSSTNKQKKDYTGLQVEDNTIEDLDDENDDDNSGVITKPFNSPEATMPEYINHKELKALLDNKKVLKSIEEKGFKASFNKEVKAGNVDVVYEMLEKIAEAMTTTLSEEEIQKSYKNILKKFKEDSLC